MKGPNGEKRPGDVVGNAVHVCKVLVGEIEETESGKQQNGGIVRAQKLTPERRSEIARQAAEARWSSARS